LLIRLLSKPQRLGDGEVKQEPEAQLCLRYTDIFQCLQGAVGAVLFYDREGCYEVQVCVRGSCMDVERINFCFRGNTSV